MNERAALALWGWAMRLAAPLLLARWWWRGRVEPGYREAMGERLGLYRQPAAAPGWVWLHAVSLGETRAAAPLIDQLRQRQPGLRLLLTHTTATGRAAGRALLREGDAQTWLPIDTPGAVRRFYAHWQPQLGLLMETEVWPNMEAQLLAAWQALPEPRPRLLIVPRHPQRFGAVAALMPGVARRSSWSAEGPDAKALAAAFWLGDSMREMPLYFALADLALLGGSFAPLGGQNLIEAAACGCPLLMGPSTFNFAEAATLSESAGAAQRVGSAAEALQRAQTLLKDEAALHAMRKAALGFATQHRGAAARMAERVLA